MKKFARNLLTLTLSVGMLAAGSLVVSAAEFKGPVQRMTLISSKLPKISRR